MIYLFKHDSTHGPNPLPLECDNEFIVSGGKYNFNFSILKKVNQKEILNYLNFILFCILYFTSSIDFNKLNIRV